MQKSRASVAEEHFYGPLTWVAIQRITLPVYIFFRFYIDIIWQYIDIFLHFDRFHSAVLLIDCWKGSYIPEQSQPIEMGEK